MTTRTVTKLTGVYHADGSLVGEVRYVLGSLLGRTHCALCDITHGSLREKASWREACGTLPVDFDAVHLDERSPDVRAVTEGCTPAVVAHTDAGLVVVLGPDELDACGGEPDALIVALRAAMEAQELVFAEGERVTR